MPNILFKTIKSIKIANNRPRIESPFANIDFSILDSQTGKSIHELRSNMQGEVSINLTNGRYIISKKPFDTFFPISREIVIPLSQNNNIIEIKLIDRTAECYYLKGKIARLIRKGTEESFAKAEQIMTQIKENHNNYLEIPDLNFVVRLELRLQNKRQEMDSKMAFMK